ncbi:MAG: endonuclease III, partial [Eubacteriaceae bacterium]
MTENKEAKRISEILKRLNEMYPDALTELKYNTTFQLLVAVMLSAQCTDKQVNKITVGLFEKYREPEDFARLDWRQLAEEIKSCGLYRNKSKNIVTTSVILTEKYNSQVPQEREEL